MYRWFSCCGPCPDALQCGVSVVETCFNQCRSPLGHRGWMQHSVCPSSYLNGILHYWSECQTVPKLCPGLKSYWVRPERLTMGLQIELENWKLVEECAAFANYSPHFCMLTPSHVLWTWLLMSLPPDWGKWYC